MGGAAPRIRVRARARDDLNLRHLDEDAAGVVIGHVEENGWIEIEAMTGLEELDREDRRVIGSWHVQEWPESPVQASEADLKTWSRTAAERGQMHVGLIVGAGSGWDAGYPVADWSDPVFGAWVATPGSRIREAVLTEEPRWLADLRATVRFRDEPHAA